MVEKKPTQSMQLALMRRDLDGILDHVKEIKEDIKSHHALREDMSIVKSDVVRLREFQSSAVTQDQFWPIKMIVYGAVGIMLTALFGALIALVVARGQP
jgi:hypothetical protein